MQFTEPIDCKSIPAFTDQLLGKVSHKENDSAAIMESWIHADELARRVLGMIGSGSCTYGDEPREDSWEMLTRGR